MATMNQIYQLVNDSAKQALGVNAPTVLDTGSLVSLGDVVMSSSTNKEAFYNTLCDRIGRTVIAIRNYTAKNRSVKRDDMEWGIVYQKISYKMKSAVENPSWKTDSQSNPFDVARSTEAVQTLFSTMSTFSYEDSIFDYQLFTAFTSGSAMGAFIAGIYTNISNAMQIAEEDLANLAVDTNIAGILIKGKASQKRNLLNEYNTATGSALTVVNCLQDLGFLRFAIREINMVLGNMKKMSYIYNVSADIPRFTPEEKQVVEILGQFASAAKTFLQSDTYHNDLVSLPNYEEVVYWQGSGTSFAFADVSKINLQNVHLAVEGNATGAVEQGGIVAFVHDVDSCASIITRRRSNSIYNPRSEVYNIFEKADKGYAVDLTENGVVFYIA